MATITPSEKKRRKGKSGRGRRRTRSGIALPFLEEQPAALSRSASLDTLAVHVPQRIRLIPGSGPRLKATIGIELPEATVVRLLAMNEQNDIVETLVDAWLPAGTHRLSNLCLPNGGYKLRLETPNMWYVAGIMIG